jgi:glucosyl-3-phosphoglycerate phosphatase
LRLLLLRHGQTIWNAEHRFQGQSDIPLDDTGEGQAERAARLLAALRPDLIVSSDLRRATATAAPLARLTGLPVSLDKDLRERFGGSWEGLTDSEITERYPRERVTWSPPDGESVVAVGDRVHAALMRVIETLSDLNDGGLAVVVSHGAALRMGMERVLGLPEEHTGILGPLSNCSWSVLGQRGPRWRILEHNAGTLPEPVLGDDR